MTISSISSVYLSLSPSLSLSQGDVLFQMAEVHRQIQMQLEDMVSIINVMKIVLPHWLTFSHYIFSSGCI